MAQRATRIHEFVAHGATVNCMQIGRKSGSVMVTGGDDKKVNVWSVGKPNAIMSLAGHTSAIECVSFDSNEQTVIAGSAGGTLKLWDLEQAKVARTLTGHRSNCVSVQVRSLPRLVGGGITLPHTPNVITVRQRPPSTAPSPSHVRSGIRMASFLRQGRSTPTSKFGTSGVRIAFRRIKGMRAACVRSSSRRMAAGWFPVATMALSSCGISRWAGAQAPTSPLLVRGALTTTAAAPPPQARPRVHAAFGAHFGAGDPPHRVPNG